MGREFEEGNESIEERFAFDGVIFALRIVLCYKHSSEGT
jgi:hypothetical protein